MVVPPSSIGLGREIVHANVPADPEGRFGVDFQEQLVPVNHVRLNSLP
jgi:hypothetical protein